jgi:hypothetical protein
MPPAYPHDDPGTDTPSRRFRVRWYIWWVLLANAVVAAVMVLSSRGGDTDDAYGWADRAWAVLVLEAIFAPILVLGYWTWYWKVDRRRRRELGEFLEDELQRMLGVGWYRRATPRDGSAAPLVRRLERNRPAELGRLRREALALPATDRLALLESLRASLDQPDRDEPPPDQADSAAGSLSSKP